MKFENVQVGDVVFISKKVETGYRRSKKFWIPGTVTRTTKTLFVVGKTRYRKSDGQSVMCETFMGYAKFLGDTTRFSDSIVTDETVEYEAYKRHVTNVIRSRKLLDTIGKRITFETDCTDIHSKLRQIKAILDKQEGK